MFDKKTIRDVVLTGRRVLVRVDFNVPLDEGRVVDDTRLLASIPTIKYLIENGACAVLCSHLGRPKGKIVPSLSLRPVAKRLSELLGQPVGFVEDCIGPKVREAVEKLQPGEIILLENTRFHPGEKANDPDFAAELASFADLFINDAFGSAHRAHASTEGVAHNLPAVAGFLMEKELNYLGVALEDPKHPYIAILGGAKISDKIGVVERLLDQADQLLIGGAMANTFFAAAGNNMADSLVEEQSLGFAKDLLEKGGRRLMLPRDLVVADAFSEDARIQTVTPDAVPDGWRAMDIGPKTIEVFSETVKGAQLVVWNGPMGVFEFGPFAAGTKALAEVVAKCEGTTIVGGGDSAAAIRQAGLMDQIDHVSTGGGASLELIESMTLPGVDVLLNHDIRDLR